MALVVAVATIGCHKFPRTRWAFGVAVAVTAFLLLFGEWHFVSDLIAGAWWGNAVALTVMAVGRAAEGSSGCRWFEDG